MPIVKYKIRETPAGQFRIEMLVEGSDPENWIDGKEMYKSQFAAEEALKRLISKREWLYDEEGNPL